MHGDSKKIYAEAKGKSFAIRILRKAISQRKKDASERQEEASLIEVYLAALGMAVTAEAAEQARLSTSVATLRLDGDCNQCLRSSG